VRKKPKHAYPAFRFGLSPGLPYNILGEGDTLESQDATLAKPKHKTTSVHHFESARLTIFFKK
jgi:hypothetical protein